MITDLRFEKPLAGFRYTHDVLWKGMFVGHATGVSSLPRENSYTWMAFVGFAESKIAREAMASIDVEQTSELMEAVPGRQRLGVTGYCTAQEVDLRGGSKGGDFSLQRRDHPLPIPWADPPQDTAELDFWQRLNPEVETW